MRNKDILGYSAGNIKYLPVFWGCALYDGCLFVIWYKDEGILLLPDLCSVTIKDNKEEDLHAANNLCVFTLGYMHAVCKKCVSSSLFYLYGEVPYLG